MRRRNWAVWLVVASILSSGLSQLSPDGKKAPADPAQPPDATVNSIGMKLVAIEPGKYLMGSTPEAVEQARRDGNSTGYDSEIPQHEVEITRRFYLSVYPVTQGQYRRVMGTDPSWFCETGGGSEQVARLSTEDFPVETVTWHNAKEFCRKLGELEKKTYRLPTEAEWEYACRAGTATPFNLGDGEAALRTAGWYRDNSGGRTHPVGSLTPNAWGLYDMHGNVCQWCEDWREANYYEHSPRKDPTGPESGEHRVQRGGSWQMSAQSCRSASRLYGRADNENDDDGFRVVLLKP